MIRPRAMFRPRRLPAAVLACAAMTACVLAGLPGRALAAAARQAPPPALSASEAILIDGSSGRMLWGLRPDREAAIASTTKLMTALVTLQHASLEATFTEPSYYPAAVDSQIGLRPGERMSVHDLLLALMLPSADDAAEDLAYNVGGGSVAHFVALMNQQALRLGLAHTHYATPIGLDTPGNYSSASDLVRLAAYDLRTQPFFARIVALPRAPLHTGDYRRTVINRNDLVTRFPWIDGVKTGHTLDAGYVLVASAHRDGMWLLSAVLGTPSEYQRDQSTLALLDYGWANFAPRALVSRGRLVARVPVAEQPGRRAEVIAAAGFSQVLPRSAAVSERVQLPRQLSGPRRRGTRVGRLVLAENGRRLASIPLVLERAIPAVSGFTRFTRFVERPITLAVILLLIAGLGLLLRRHDRVRGARRTRTRARSG